jgi:hypothetical protein
MILVSRAMAVPPLMRLVERALAWHAYPPQDGASSAGRGMIITG